jgi:hypothetical protein
VPANGILSTFFRGDQLAREERDTNGDGIFDLRIIYENGQIVSQEANTNADRLVDVWVNFRNGERVEQLEDQSYQGKITARYAFQGGQVIQQEQVSSGDPPRASAPFAAVEEELQTMAGYSGASSGSDRVSLGLTVVESSAQIK